MAKKTAVPALIFLISALFLSAAVAEEYIIGPDDVLDINVWKEDSLTKAYPVDKDGNIAMPYLKEVNVGGLTTQGAAEFITNRLKGEGYLTNPVVTVAVKEYHSQRIMLFGAIKKPGNYYLKGKTLVLDFLSRIDYPESGGKMTILRKDKAGAEEAISIDLSALLLNGDLSQNREVIGGDKIIISRVVNTGQQVYILGEVRTPGPYNMERGVSVLEALRMAGGFTEFANKGRVKVIREENGKKNTIKVNLDKVGKGDKSQDITLQAGDVLIVEKSWF